MSFQLELSGAGKGAFSDALTYLNKSPTAKQIIAALQALPEVILVIAKDGETYKGISRSMWRPPTALTASEAKSYGGGILHWWVLDWTKVKDTQYQTPAIALMHEMGHAYQYFFAGFREQFDNIARGKCRARTKIPKVEADNLRRCEIPVVSELNKLWSAEAVRLRYTDNVYLSASQCRELGIQKYVHSLSLKSPKQQATFRSPWQR
jgi:hypothetical protein